jgi:formylglycine-generating enzyme required for sulfatase activity
MNPIASTRDGRLFAGQCFLGDGLAIDKQQGMLNGFDFGPGCCGRRARTNRSAGRAAAMPCAEASARAARSLLPSLSMRPCTRRTIAFAIALLAAGPLVEAAPLSADEAARVVRGFNFRAVRDAIEDLASTYGARYPNGRKYLARLGQLEAQSRPAAAGGGPDLVRLAGELAALRRAALLENPLLEFDRMLAVKRAPKTGPARARRAIQPSPLRTAMGEELALPLNHYSLSAVEPNGWDNEIVVLPSPRTGGAPKTVFRPRDPGYVGEIELHWDARRLLFTMASGNRYRVFEMSADGSGIRQVTPDDQPDVDNFDAAYLPNGKVVFCGNASYQAVPCWNGVKTVACIFSINRDGTGMRQLTFDQDEDSSPVVLNTGQVLYSRWEYTNTPHVFPHLLFQMNPDGAGQREYYKSGSYWPNSVYFARPVPGHPTQVIGVVSGYHGDARMGELFLIDPAKGRSGKAGMVQRIPGRNLDFDTPIKDHLTADRWPKYLHPYPLSDKYFIVSMKPSPEAGWGIWLVDVWDNSLPLYEARGYALLEPTPVRAAPVPPVLPEEVDWNRKDGVVFLQDVYEGPGLKGVPRGSVKRLRVHAYHFGYRGLAGWEKIGIDGPWDVMRIVGTVPVEEDGSAMFRVPANTPLALQPLDAGGRALQVMRSWFTVMPGETRSCVGCHESQNTVPPVRRAAAALKPPAALEPWFGPARGVDFERDVQPVLDAYCAGCHDGRASRPDLRSSRQARTYKGTPGIVPAWWGDPIPSVWDAALQWKGGRKEHPIRMTPAYEALHPYARRYGLEGDYVLPYAAEYHVSTSELVQMLEKGHHGVRPDRDAWDRIVTWIDLNVPAHGTWGEVLPIPFDGRRRRAELAKLYANLEEDLETVPDLPRPRFDVRAPAEDAAPTAPAVPGWPFDLHEARERQRAAGFSTQKTVDLGDGEQLKLVLIPAGEFAMGDPAGTGDERQPRRVRIEKPFWMGTTEITNRQYGRFDAAHDSRYINTLNMNTEVRGFPVNEPGQPVVRVSWAQAMEFCRRLSAKSGLKVTLPSEEQWEWAARAGTATPFFFGPDGTDFSHWANMADASLKGFANEARNRPQRALTKDQPDWMLRVAAVNDGAMVSSKAGSYGANAWGLLDVHGNVAEWTRSDYLPRDTHGAARTPGRKVVRGGSWNDRPHRCRSGFRWGYPEWQRVYNVGFRVVAEVQ